MRLTLGNCDGRFFVLASADGESTMATKVRPDAAKEPERCAWARGEAGRPQDLMMRAYHDEEWGVPLRDSRALWELLMLEGFQAGLSWSIILRKREGFRRAFAGFDPERVARFGEEDVARLMADEGIIRARAKIAATIAGAKIYVEMERSGEDFAAWAWGLVGGKTIPDSWDQSGPIPAKTELSERVSKALKARGFKFVGPVIVYSWMQAAGMVNDHAVGCWRRSFSG
jgi:DNA-3-methyladenine glycosylase I